MRAVRIAVRALALSLTIGGAACDTTEPEPGPQAIKVGVILAETGPASFIGGPERLVLEALMAERAAVSPGALRVVLEYEDSGGNLDRARELFDAFATDSTVIAIIGPSTSGESIPLAMRAEEAGLALLSLGASKRIVVDESGDVRPWAYHFAQSDDLAATRLAGVMQQEADTNVALLFSDDAFGTSGADDFRTAADVNGIRIAHDAAYQANLSDGDPVAAAVPGSVAGIMIWGTAPGPALLVQSLVSAGHSAQLYLSHGDASQAFIDAAGAAAHGVILVGSRVLYSAEYLTPGDPRDDVILAYQALWSEHASGPPSHFGGHAHDALTALLAVASLMPAGTSAATRRQLVRDGLEELPTFHGVTGTFDFSPADHGGLDAEAFGVFRIESAQFVPYVPSSVAAMRIP